MFFYLGRGVTKDAERHSKRDSNNRKVVVIDTPGLTHLFGERGTQTLEAVLKNPDGITKLNFVFDLRSGRIFPEDIQTIDVVCVK